MNKCSVVIDTEAEAASVNFLDKLTDRLISFGDSVNVDLTAEKHVISVEFLSFDTLNFTRDELLHMNPSSNLEILSAVECAQRALRDSLSETAGLEITEKK